MPKFVIPAAFDSKIFQISVGRMDLEDVDLEDGDKYPSVWDVLRNAHSSGFRLIYLSAPPQQVSRGQVESTLAHPVGKLPGNIVDMKTTYTMPLGTLDSARLCERAYRSPHFRIKRLEKEDSASRALLDLSITSGSFSRFNVDSKISREGYQAMFETWVINSVNRSVADEVFVAYKNEAQQSREIGFITVKRRENAINIGLLAVHESARRLGVASSLLSRAALWAMEEVGYEPSAFLEVITQGSNEAACRCYEAFGFSKVKVQGIHHVWLPEDLSGPISRADRDPIPYCKQHLTGHELSHVQHLFSTGMLDSSSHYNFKCATKLQSLLGESCQRVLVVQSGTAALEMAALLCKLTPGDEVIMPSYTFSSTANAFVLRGAVPVFVDVRLDTCNIDERLIEAAITPRTKVVCVVHYGGVPCEMDTICAIARKHNLLVVEDAAQGFLATYKGRPLGSIGDFGCFSFHYTKNVICGEGGALSVNHAPERVRDALILFDKGTNRHDFMLGHINKYEWIDVGSSYVPSEISCAILWAQLENAHAITAKRKNHYLSFLRSLQSLVQAGVLLSHSTEPAECESNGHIFFLIFASASLRNIYEEGLRRRGISAFTHYVPLHSAPAGIKYGRVAGFARGESSPAIERAMAVTRCVSEGLLRLPVWADLTEEQVSFIISTLQEIAAD